MFKLHNCLTDLSFYCRADRSLFSRTTNSSNATQQLFQRCIKLQFDKLRLLYCNLALVYSVLFKVVHRRHNATVHVRADAYRCSAVASILKCLCSIQASMHITSVFVSAALTQVAPGFGTKLNCSYKRDPTLLNNRIEHDLLFINLAPARARRNTVPAEHKYVNVICNLRSKVELHNANQLLYHDKQHFNSCISIKHK